MAETAALQTLGAPADRRDPLPTSSLKEGGEKTARPASLFSHRERSRTGGPDSTPGRGEE